MKNRTRIRLLLAAGASLGTIAAAPALAQDATWSATPENVVFGGRSDYQDPDNWVPATVPTGTATFDATSETDIFFENLVGSPPISIGRFVFNAGAPAYTFSLQSDDFTFSGEGIVNNSTAAQTLIVGNRSDLHFINSSSAGSAHLIGEGSQGRISFENDSNAGTSQITIGGNGFGRLEFTDNSSAADATISNPFGNIFFFGNSTAGNSQITNLNGMGFSGASSLGTAVITNRSGLRISADASGGSATVINETGGLVDISQGDGFAASTSIGSLSGAGNVQLGGRNLTLGALNFGDTIGGAITDGGDLGGTGGSLTKVGTGTLTLTGDSTYTGNTSVTGGTLIVTGSIDGTNQVDVGRVGTGMLVIQSGGSINALGGMTIGHNAGNGTVTVTGADSSLTLGGGLSVAILTGGGGGVGRLNIEDGATVTSNGASVVFQTSLPSADGRATITGAGSTWTTGDMLVQGPAGTHLITVSAGGIVNSSEVDLAGSVLATGSGSQWNTGHLIVGPNLSANGNPAGRLAIAGGAVVTSSSAVLAEGGSFTSAVTIDGTGSAWTVGSDLVLSPTAFQGAQVTVLNGGTLTVDGGTGTIEVGPDGGASFFTVGGGAPGTLPGNVEAASLLVGSGSFLAFDHEATDHVFELPIGGTGQILAGRGTTILTGDSSAFAGTTTIVGGATLQLGDYGVTGGPIGVGSGGASGALGGDIVNDGALIIARGIGILALDGVISGAGTLTQNGNPSTTVSAQNSYTGATTINGGGFFVTGSIASSSEVTVNGGGRLGGTGTVARTNVVGGGTLLPGAPLPPGGVSGALGTLSFTGNLTLTNANYIADIASASADLITTSGSATLAGRLAAVANDGNHAPGQYTLLTASGGRTGTFGSFAIVGNFGGLAASLSYTADSVLLDLAPFAGTGEERWLANPATSLWNTATNWDPAAVPDGTARFGPSTITTLTFAPGTTQIGRLLFDADAPAYEFNLDTRLISQGGGSSLNILGEGVVNNSQLRPTFHVIAAARVVDGGGGLNFFNASSAGNARISSFNSSAGVNDFATTFFGTSTAADALIDNVGVGTAFRESSTAGSATINNGEPDGFPGGSAFFDNSNAGMATITNGIDIGGLAFFDNASAADATIFNRATVSYSFGRGGDVGNLGIRFEDSSTAGSAVLTNDTGSTGFLDTSSAGTATIVNSNAGGGSFFFSTSFLGSSSAGSASITNNAGGTTGFDGLATAADATIVNNDGGRTAFFSLDSGGSPTITNNDGGRTTFQLTGQAPGATIVNNEGGVVDISEDPQQTPALVAPSVAIGSVSGAGDVTLGSRNLALGALGGDDTISGTIADGGQFGGAGGSLTKVGSGMLTLTGANTYTGGTTITAGALQLGDGGETGSIAGDVANNAALVIDRTGTVALDGIISGSGALTQNGTVTTTLSGTNSYTGATTVNGGILLVTGSIADSDVTVNSGATLGGTGTVGATSLADGGMIAPGTSIGTLTVDGDILFGNANYLAEVAPAAADLIDVKGAATLDGLLTAIATGGEYSPGQFVVLTADGGLGGTFDDLVTQGSFSGLSAVLEYDSNNVVLILASAEGTPDWDGSVSTDWFVNGNWDNDSVPTSGVAATINTTTPNPTLIAAEGAESGDLSIGTLDGAEGRLTISGGGTLATDGGALVGDAGGVGEVLVTGAGSSWTISEGLQLAGIGEGAGAFGTLRIEDGGAVTSDGVILSQLAARGSRAIVSGAGSTWNTGSFTATGLANLTGDLVTIEDGAEVVSTSSAMATQMTVTGTGSSWTSGALLVGSSSGINPGRLFILDGASVESSTAQIGFSPVGAGSGSSSRGTVTVSAATWNVGSDLPVGIDEFNAGTLVIRDGGTVTIAGGEGDALVGPNSQLMIGGAATAAPGTLAAAGVGLDSAALLTFSHDSAGHVFANRIDGEGHIDVTLGTTILTGDNSAFSGETVIGEVIDLVGRGGILQLGNGGATGSLGGDIVNDNQLIVNRTGTLTLAGTISGSGSFTQEGTVTTTMTGTNSYTGATTVNGGTLLVNGSIAASPVTVNEGATLGGTGSFGDTNIADGGMIAPGNSIGTLSIDGDLVFGDGTYLVEVSETAADLIDVTGTASLAGTLTAIETGTSYTVNQQYTVLTAAGGVTGGFGAVTMEGDFSGFEAQLSYDANNVFLILARSGPTNTATTSFTDAIVFNAPTIVVEQVSLFETRIIGRLAGGIALFDETYDAAFGSATVQAGVQAARTAITSAGGPGVVVLVSDPVLVSRDVTSATTSTSIFSLADTTNTVTTTTTFGPANVTIGEARSCADAIAVLPGGTRPECGPPGGQSFDVEPGTVNINTNTHTEYAVDEVRTDTTTETISETYELTGTVVSVGTVHAAAISGVYDLAEHLLHRVGQEGAPGPFGAGAPPAGEGASNLLAGAGESGWAEGYAFRNRADARGGLPAERRDARGLAGGLSVELGEGLLVGFGVDQGWLDLEVPDALETADVELTQIAIGGRFGSGPFSLALSASYGFGSVDSERRLVATSTASYDVGVLGLFAEASYVFEAGAWRLVPKIGIDHVGVDADDFVETGTVGLVVAEHDEVRTRIFPGLEFGRSFEFGNGGGLDLSGSVSYLAVIGGEERTIPVAFTIAPGTPLVMRGLSERDSALVGARTRLRLSPSLDLYLNYDGRFGDGYDSHGGTAGLSLVW